MRWRYNTTMVFPVIAICAIGFSTSERSVAAEVAATVDNTKQNAPPPLASPAAAATCKAAWEAADLNKNGILDPDEVLVYNAKIKAENKPSITDTFLNETEFMKKCETLTAHE